MTQDEVVSRLAQHQLISVLKIESLAVAGPLVEAICGGGLPMVEVTLRTECALDSIQSLSSIKNLVLGAGTVLNQSQAAAAISAGAQFIVSPGFDVPMIEYCLNHQVAVFPGISTASEIQQASNLGLEYVKFFPAEAIGGLAALHALSTPFSNMKFIPTGGIHFDNFRDYLAHDAVLAVGGSWMAKASMYQNGNFLRVREAVARSVEVIGSTKDSEGGHER